MEFFDLVKLIPLVMRAHSEKAMASGDSAFKVSGAGREVRMWDGKTPYFIHPLWCAMTILTEERLPENIRKLGAQVLLFHDVPEDTTEKIPDDLDEKAKEIIAEMLFENSAHELREIWGRSDLAKLFKLYDKVSNFLDASWMVKERGIEYLRERLDYILKLADFVEEKYGILNIVVMARAIVDNL